MVGFAAAYHPHGRNIELFTTISLGKRNTLTRDDGTFDPKEAVRSASRTKNKHEHRSKRDRLNLDHPALPIPSKRIKERVKPRKFIKKR